MKMPATTHSRYQRHFGWHAAAATMVILGLVTAEFSFPGDQGSTYELRRMLLAVTAVVALISLAGFAIATSLVWLARKSAQEEEAADERHARRALTEAPANERLRALRAVTSSVERAPNQHG
ncbi:hypothetical protein [Variovorax sp. KK3]|uniref:hypothetical protein n=1 Tax=Variovorax sp. KK3 TaxID=1855728 RepID=UPI00097C5409|nr:hypothetical protein [Variovorax sp. KK3]